MTTAFMAMPLVTALTYFPACSHGSTRTKHDRSSPASSARFRRPSLAPILAEAAAVDSVVVPGNDHLHLRARLMLKVCPGLMFPCLAGVGRCRRICRSSGCANPR
jgi:hypothetical protein